MSVHLDPYPYPSTRKRAHSLKSPSHFVPHAESGRSSCKGKCKAKIEQGALRFGSGKDAAWDGTQWFWRCGACVTPTVCQNMINSCGSAEEIPGFDELTIEQRDEVEEIFERMTNGKDEIAPPKAQPKLAGGVAKKSKTKKQAAATSTITTNNNKTQVKVVD